MFPDEGLPSGLIWLLFPVMEERIIEGMIASLVFIIYWVVECNVKGVWAFKLALVGGRRETIQKWKTLVVRMITKDGVKCVESMWVLKVENNII